MREQSKPKLHIPFLVLDFIGTMLVALGAYEMTSGDHLVAESLRFDHYDIVLMILGFMLMVPLVAWVIKNKVAGLKQQ